MAGQGRNFSQSRKNHISSRFLNENRCHFHNPIPVDLTFRIFIRKHLAKRVYYESYFVSEPTPIPKKIQILVTLIEM